MRKRLSRRTILYWIEVMTLSILVVLLLAVVLGGLLQSYRHASDSEVNFWDGVFGLFAGIITILVSASVRAYFRKRESQRMRQSEKEEARNRNQISPYCRALRKLSKLLEDGSGAAEADPERRQRRYEAWAWEWKKVWDTEVKHLIAKLYLIEDKNCRNALDKAFGAVYSYVEGKSQLGYVRFMLGVVSQNCEACRDLVLQVDEDAKEVEL